MNRGGSLHRLSPLCLSLEGLVAGLVIVCVWIKTMGSIHFSCFCGARHMFSVGVAVDAI